MTGEVKKRSDHHSGETVGLPQLALFIQFQIADLAMVVRLIHEEE